MLAHVALQTVEANAHTPGVDDIRVSIAADALAQKQPGDMPPAEVVITGAHVWPPHMLLTDRLV
jgi:hypothetical protein